MSCSLHRLRQVIHLSIFVVAVLYATFVGALVSLSLWISRTWRRMEAMDYEQFVQTKGVWVCGCVGVWVCGYSAAIWCVGASAFG